MFVGMLRRTDKNVSSIVLSLLSIILKNCANAIESFELYRLFRENERRYRELADSLPQTVFECDRRGRLRFLNSTVEKQFGHPRDSFVRKGKLLDLLSPEERERTWEFFAQAMEQGTGGVLECRAQCTDAKTFPAVIYVSPIIQEGRCIGLRGIIADITQRMGFERELRGAKEEAQAASKAKSEFLARMSHEIRTPINGILGLTELALEGAADDEQREYVEMARYSAEVLLNLVNDLLDFSSLEADELTLEAMEFDLVDLLDKVVGTLVVQARKKGLDLHVALDDGVPRCLYGDPSRLRQVLHNLGDNAVKFTDSGEVRLEVGLAEGAEPPAEAGGAVDLEFVLRDTGMGIPEDKLKTVFESFSQSEGAMARRHNGAGLGLSISKRLVEMMGGTLRVQSLPGEGSVFSFSLRLAAPESCALPAEGPPPQRVLLAEGDMVCQRYVRGVLERQSHTVRVAGSGNEALEALRAERYDVVLVNPRLPDMDGRELARAVRAMDDVATDAAVPLVGLMPRGTDKDWPCYRESGLTVLLPRPFDGNTLLRALAQALTD
jgi:hypothetical protein